MIMGMIDQGLQREPQEQGTWNENQTNLSRSAPNR